MKATNVQRCSKLITIKNGQSKGEDSPKAKQIVARPWFQNSKKLNSIIPSSGLLCAVLLGMKE